MNIQTQPLIPYQQDLHPLFTGPSATPCSDLVVSKKYLTKRAQKALYLPGINLLRKLYNAARLQDRVQLIDASLQVISLASKVYYIFFRVLFFSGFAKTAMAVCSIAFSALFLTLDLGLEIYRMGRLALFAYRLQKAGGHQKSESVDRQLTWLKKEFFSSTDLLAKESLIRQRSLSRMIRPWMVEKIHHLLLNPSEVKQEKEELIEQIKEQINKAFIVHGIALLSIATGIIFYGSFLLPPAIPFLLPLIIGYGGFLVDGVRYLAFDAFLNHPGYKWDWSVHSKKVHNFFITKKEQISRKLHHFAKRYFSLRKSHPSSYLRDVHRPRSLSSSSIFRRARFPLSTCLSGRAHHYTNGPFSRLVDSTSRS